MNVLVSDPAAVMRVMGLVRTFAAHDDEQLNAIMEATMEATVDGDNSLVCTFGSLVWLAAALADRLARAGGSDVEHVLDAVIRSTDTLDRPLPPPPGYVV